MIDQAKELRERMNRISNEGLGRNTSSVSGHLIAKKARLAKAIAVTSGKGGVGKSNISLFLALSLVRLRKKVIILDADLGLANIHILLGINSRYNLSHVVSGECSIEDAVCKGPEGISILPGASGLETMANLDSLNLEKLLRKLQKLEVENDFLILDTGAGIGQSAMQLCSSADSAFLVLTPEPTSLADSYATVKQLYSRNMNNISVIVNMASSQREGEEIFAKLSGLVKKFLKKDIKLSAILPLDKNVPKLVRMQQNLLTEKPNSLIATRIGVCAKSLCGMPNINNREGFFTKLLSFQKKYS